MEDLNEDKILKILGRLKQALLKKDSHFYPEFGAIPIWDSIQLWKGDQESADNGPAIILLRVVLAANRKYNTHVKPNIDRIVGSHPELNSFESLESLMNNKSKAEFYEFWGHKNLKKYNTLKNLLEAIHQLRAKYEIVDDFKLMHEWAMHVDLVDYENDIIGRIKNIAIATIQHLRMDFGVNTVKPDQRVIEVLEREFGFKKVSQTKAIKLVETIAKLANIKTRQLDLVLVNYGSGYYDNRNYKSQQKLRKEIAKNLLKFEIDKEIITKATGVEIKNE